MSSRNCSIRVWLLIAVCFLVASGCAAHKQAVDGGQPATRVRITLTSTEHIYDGAPKAAVASTDPAGLQVKITYDGSTAAPVNAGKYKVVAAVEDAHHEGSARATMTIVKAPQTIVFDALAGRTFGDADFPPGATSSSGMPVSYASSNTGVAEIAGDRVRILGAGTAMITASQAGDSNHLEAKSKKQTLVVNKATAAVSLGGVEHSYDGNPKPATAATTPGGLQVKITYDGKDKAPVNAGSYTVTAMVRDANYEGSAAATMTITKAAQTITFNALTARTFGDKPFDLDATLSGELKPAYESSDPAVAAVSGKGLKITGAGTATITVSQAGDRNHLPADPVRQPLLVKKALARVELSGLEHTYDGKPKPAGAKTDPRGLTVTITYDGKETPPVNAGSYTVAATVRDADYEGSASGTLTVAKAAQKIAFKSQRARTFGDADFLPGATTSSGIPVSYISSNIAVAEVIGGQVRITGAGTAVITASQAGDGNFLAAEPVQQTITVNKAPAAVVLGNLVQTYDGKPKPASAATTPAGLKVNLTYDGKDAIPVNAGNYTVVGTIQDANYEGSAKAAMIIAKAPQTIAFDAPANRTFGDAEFSPGAMTSAGLALSYKSSDPRVAIVSEGKVRIIGAGTATISVAQAGDSNHLPAAPVQQTIRVNKAPAAVILGDLEHTYDGKPKPATSATTPGGLQVKITYDGKDKAPVNAGSYTVTAMVQDANYEGSAAATMTIAKAAQTITFDALTTKTYGDKPFSIIATLSSGLKAAYESSDPRVAAIRGDEATIKGAGTATITAVQPGDGNYLPAEPVQQTLTVNKAHAMVTLGGLKQTYDGKPKQAAAATKPGGLTVNFTYDGNSQAPVNAGSYEVVGIVQEANYEGTAGGAIIIEKAPQKITFNAVPVMTYTETPFRVTATISSGLTATYDSSNASVAVISGDQAMIKGVGTTTITAYQGGDGNHLPAEPVRQTLTVNKAPVKVTLGDLSQTYDGKPKQAKSTTIPEKLIVSMRYNEKDMEPVDAGTYAVVATVQEANYEGNATAMMTIAKAPQTITFNALSAMTYGDETPYLLFATVTSGLTASYASSDPTVAAISGNQVLTRNTGTTTITAFQAGDRNHLPADPVQQVMTVKKAPAWIGLSGLDSALTYDGKPKRAMVMTRPEGLNVSITYDGNSAAPASAGRYQVVATVREANYEGTTTGRLTITPAFQEIQFPPLAIRTVGAGPFDLPVFLSSGLTASFTSSDPTVATVTGNTVTIIGAGTTTITAFQRGDRNYQSAEPVKRILIVRGQPPRIVVFPVENLSGRPTPLKDVRQAIVQGLSRQGAVVLDDGEMQQFMARHRVRHTGGVDTITAKAWKDEAGMEAVLITSLDQYDDSEVPKIAITCRLVTTGETPSILWMENIDLSGDDSPGLFGAGLIDQIGPLQDRAIGQLLGSLAAFYADKPVPGRSSVAGSFRPKEAHESPFLAPNKTYTIAVMPFYNRSKASKAGEVLALRFVSQLVKNKAFEVMEPGVVRQKLLNYRIIMSDGPSREDMKSFFINLETDLILSGRLFEYQEGRLNMEFDVQVYERKSSSAVWSSWSHNRGDDAVVVFDWKRVNNVGALASKMARSIVREMTTK
jgi:hypothetical protein